MNINMDPAFDLQELKSSLIDRTEGLVLHLLGEPSSKSRRFWRWGRKGAVGYDFQRHRFRCFESGQGGDALDLIAFANPGFGLRETVAWARDWTGERAPMACRRSPHVATEATDKVAAALQLWNEARPAPGTFVQTYLHSRGLGAPVPGSGFHAQRVDWGQVLEGCARELMAIEQPDDEAGAAEDAEGFLRDALSSGPVPTKELRAAAAAHGHKWRTVERAKAVLGILAIKGSEGLVSGWKWKLPDPKTANCDSEDRHHD